MSVEKSFVEAEPSLRSEMIEETVFIDEETEEST